MKEGFYDQLNEGLKPVSEEIPVRGLRLIAATLPIGLRIIDQLSEFKQNVLAGDRNVITIQPTRRVDWNIIISSNPKRNKKRLDRHFLKVLKGRIEL